jgi:hypothetical protein
MAQGAGHDGLLRRANHYMSKPKNATQNLSANPDFLDKKPD